VRRFDAANGLFMAILHDAGTLLSLLAARSGSDLVSETAELERRRRYRWLPIGGIEGNYGLVNIGSDPGLALVERITNAIDAIVEREALNRRVDAKTPRKAIELLLGIPDGRIARADAALRDELARSIIVSVSEGKNKDHPTLAVRDFGVGIEPDQFALTILSLARSNKVDKPYLCGAYGQGGSTTLAFCDVTLIAAAAEHGDVGVTVIRFNELDPRTNKNGRYEYLVDANGDVPRIPRREVDFPRGTLVRHFNYAFKAHAGPAGAAQQSLAHLCGSALFDPLLPITIEECRARYTVADGEPAPTRLVFAGTSRRLAEAAPGAIEYRQSVKLSLRRKRDYGDIWVHYYVLSQTDGDTPPTAAFLDPAYPTLMTYFGQTHGRESRRFIADELRLPFLKHALIIQIELDGLTPAGRRELLSSTRDRLKRGSLYEYLFDVVSEALRDDPRLAQLNADRRQQLLTKQSSVEEERIRKRFVELMDRYKAGADARAAARDGDKRSLVSPSSSEANGNGQAAEIASPLPTGEKPTFLKVSGTLPLRLRPDRHGIITIESDAPDRYLVDHPEAQFSLIDDPAGRVEIIRHTDFRGGRARITLKLTAGASGERGTMTIYLVAAADDVAVDTPAPYVVVEPPPADPGGRDGRSGVSVPRIEAVHRERWSILDWNESSVADVMTSSDRSVVYVNMDNRHLQRLIVRAGYQEQGLARLKNNYLVYVAFYAYLQNRQHGDFRESLDEPALEAYLDAEMDRVAQTVIFSLSSADRAEAFAES
jgi:hypothetical protein